MSDAGLRKQFPTIFGPPGDNRSIVIALDTSGSMYNKLDSVKTHLIEFLLDLALHQNVSFNLLEFNSEIRCWADEMVACSQATVEVAIPWIKALSPKTGTNTLDALVTAFDNECDSVYIVTDGLPDQHPFDILDEVVYASNQRPVHCIYLTGDTSDAVAIRFLENLATETHGSFLMASVARYGCMEKITPVYRADHAHERLVRTNQGRLHLASNKFCSITASLSGAPILPLHPAVLTSDGYMMPYVYEPYWWTRYHTAKTFMRSANKLGDSLVHSNMGVAPSAAVMLIGQKVVARRQEDGFYYPGTVNNQLSTEVFLVEFHPTNVGDYKETKYQETAIHDIISFTDALRHPVIPGDRVLAPMAEGNKFCPAIVIAGMEYRGTNVEGLDTPLTVSLCDGRTRDLVPNSAIWIPGNLYDRISLELKVPQSARKPLKAVAGYPMNTLPGYPRSGMNPIPLEYSKLYPSMVDCGDVLMDCTWFGWPKFVGVHNSAMYKPKSAPPVSFKASEITSKASQIEPLPQVQPEPEKEKEVTIAEEPKEDVIVEEPAEETEEEREETEKIEETEEEEISEEEYLKMLEDLCDNTDTQVVCPRPKQASMKYTPWKNHWRTDPIPEMMEPNRPGPFRDTAMKVPMELRELRMSEWGVENSNSQFAPTKSARYPRRNESSIYRMNVLPHAGPTPLPHPPSRPHTSAEFPRNLGEAQRKLEQLDALKRDFRRRRVILREDERVNKMLDGERMCEVMRDQHRERVLDHMNRERARHETDREAMARVLLAKRQLAVERRELESEKAAQDVERGAHRLDARRALHMQRAEAEARRRMDMEARAQQERSAKDARSQGRWQQRHDQLEAEDRERLLRESRLRGVKVGRRERFRLLEAQGQQNKELKATIFKDNQAVFQSAISY